MAATVTRIQFALPARSTERLNTLKIKTEAASYAEVVRNALRLYEAMVEEAGAGSEFLIRRKDGIVVSYKVFI